jgi:hypothetical protein
MRPIPVLLFFGLLTLIACNGTNSSNNEPEQQEQNTVQETENTTNDTLANQDATPRIPDTVSIAPGKPELIIPKKLIGSWTDECIVDIYESVEVAQKNKDILFKLNCAAIKNSKKISPIEISKKSENEFDCTFLISGKPLLVHFLIVEDKVLIVTSEDGSSTTLFNCGKISDIAEFDALYTKFKSN